MLLQRRDAHNSERHDDVAPPPELYRPVDAREQQRVANVIRGVLRRPNRDFLERRRARALRQTRNGRRRSGSEDTRPGQPFAFTQETGGVELAGAHRVVWLMGVRPQDIPHLLALGGATIEDRFVRFRDGGGWRFDDELRRVGGNRVDRRARRVEGHDGRDRVTGRRAHRIRRSRGRVLRHGGDGVTALRHRDDVGKIQNLTGIDPVGILDHVGVEPIDLRPQQRVVEIHLRDGPQRLTACDGMAGGKLFLGGGGRLRRILLGGVPMLRGVLRRQDDPRERQRRQGQE